MTEKVGNVVLDLSYYSGNDCYSDGTIEDELLKIVQEHPVSEFPEMIEAQKNWPVFYHLSPFRSNIIDWIPFKKTDKVLEIGAGCGAITGSIAKKVASVTCIDLSKKRSLVNAHRNKEQDNITIMVGNFQDIEPHLPCDYDYVLLIGVFEYGQSYIGGETPYEDFMAICNRHRAVNGHMIIAIENKFGLKYWAGCREDHVGGFYAGLEGYPKGGAARTFTKKGLEKIMKKVGINQHSFYYPYPDYKFMTTIYSDRYLPKKGELSNNLRNFDRDRMINFDEKQVFDQIIEEGEFPLFSNSYLLVVGPAFEVIYSKFSNDRALPWAIRTSIYENAFGELRVEKVPDTKAAWGHIKNTAKAYELLSKRYEGTKVVMDSCLKKGNGLVFSFCNGRTLEELLDERLAKADVTGFKALIEEYMKWLSYGESTAISNIDFIFPNIIIDGGKWQVIDYEWSFEKLVPAREIAFRAFYNYMLGSENRQACQDMLYKDILDLTDAEIEEFTKEEKEFQNYITGKRAAVADMRELIGFSAFDTKEMQEFFLAKEQLYDSQLFWDFGEGFSAENCKVLKGSFINLKDVMFESEVPQGLKTLRIDPCSFACVVRVKDLRNQDKSYTKDEIQMNGTWISEDTILFTTNDPNILVSGEGLQKIVASLEVYQIPEDFAQLVHDKVNKKRKLF